jgi:hypothetical protein
VPARPRLVPGVEEGPVDGEQSFRTREEIPTECVVVAEHLGQSVKGIDELLTMRPQPQQLIEDLARIHALYERVPSEARKLVHRGGTFAQPGARPVPAEATRPTGSERSVRYAPLNRPSAHAALP